MIDFIDAYQNVNTCIEDIKLFWKKMLTRTLNVAFKKAMPMQINLNLNLTFPELQNN